VSRMFTPKYDFEFVNAAGEAVQYRSGITHCSEADEAVRAHPDRFGATRSSSFRFRNASPGTGTTRAQLRSINEAELRGEGWSEDEITRALADIDKGVRRVTGSPAKVGGTRSVAKSNDKKVHKLPHRDAPFQLARPGAQADDVWSLAGIRWNLAEPHKTEAQLRDRALRAIERVDYPHPGVSKEQARAHVERLIRSDSEVARRVLLTGSPLYQRAFGKTVLGQSLTTDEQRALAISTNSGSDGGVDVPFNLDSSVVPVSNGAANPYRQIARVVRLTSGNTWQGVTATTAASAQYDNEADETSDDSPSFGQPEVKVERGSSFGPLSFEVGDDWTHIQGELTAILADAKDIAEAEKFTTVLLAGAIQTVDSSADDGTVSAADVRALTRALPPRFRARASFVSNDTVLESIKAADADNSVALVQFLPTNDGPLDVAVNGYRHYEAPVPVSTSADAPLLVFGSFDPYFTIVEKIGQSLDVIPDLPGSSRRPTGQRGALLLFRSNAVVLDDNAFRTLKVC
jgi:HK97 family phage major capsid protein